MRRKKLRKAPPCKAYPASTRATPHECIGYAERPEPGLDGTVRSLECTSQIQRPFFEFCLGSISQGALGLAW
jgi:hypothetical protein